jgi:DNA-directed RNA polymerase specialized sigma24 family protein
MPVSDELLERALRLEPAAVEELLTEVYPSVRRMAVALVGREDVGGRVVRGVMNRGLRVLPTWRAGLLPENWFYHHTVLSAREAEAAVGAPREPQQDPLVTHAPPPGPTDSGYVAFVRAVRRLPQQQTEAFVLYHGEHLNPRLLGVAMDCSSQAAENHLRAATEALAAMSGGPVEPHAATLAHAYDALSPSAAEPVKVIRPQVRRAVRARLFRRFVRGLVVLLILGLVAAAAWAGWHWRHVLQDLLHR